MNESDRGDARVDGYLACIRVGLRGLPEREVEDILLELRGHIAERLVPGVDVDRVLEAMGEPSTIARQYRDENVMERAECARSPITVLYGVYLLRRRSVAAFGASLLAGLGFAFSLLLVGASGEKLLKPRDVGLWTMPGHWIPFRITVDGPGSAGSRELLGWWFVPAGIAVGALLMFATTRFGLWWIHRSRRTITRSTGA